MKKLVLAASILTIGAVSVSAADLPVKARPYVAPAPVITWTGCYLGAGAGYGMFNKKREVILPGGDVAFQATNGPGSSLLFEAAGAPGATLASNETFGGQGWLATAQVGCDYQFAGNWLIGGFADGDWTGLRGDQSLFGVFRGEEKMRSSFAVGGRVGYLVTPSLLTYVSGGYTEAEFSGVNYGNSFTAAAFELSGPSPGTAIALEQSGSIGLQLSSQRYNGFFIGGGTEYALGWLPGLFWKTEYRFADYRSATTNLNCVGVCSNSLGTSSTGLAERSRATVQTVRSELVWRFNWGGGPLVAKY